MENTLLSSFTSKHLTKQIIKRAAIVAVIIGGALTLVNQSEAILGDAELQTVRTALAFLTPFLIVAISQVFGIRAAHKALSKGIGNHQGFFQTLFSHGIFLRSVVLGLIAGGATTIITALSNMAAGQSLNQMPLNLILPAMLLPIIFGAMSQVLSFRRTVRQSDHPAATLELI